MGTEIERKFLVVSDAWRAGAEGLPYEQGYLAREPAATVRIRLAGQKGFVTIKGQVLGFSRPEFEYEIPAADARALLQMCRQPLIEKTRYRILHAGKVWEVDEFRGANAGLVVAEVELACETEIFELPPWVGAEVSHDHRYYNSQLSLVPFSEWGHLER